MTSVVDIFYTIITVDVNMSGLCMRYTVNFDQLSTI